MYGPTDDKNIGYSIKFAEKFPFFPIPGHGKWPRQPIYIDDMCYLVISFSTLSLKIKYIISMVKNQSISKT